MTISRDLSTKYGDGAGGVKHRRGEVWKYPALLLRPEGSYSWTLEDGVQTVTPVVTGNAQVVDGQYGDAWDTKTTDSVDVRIDVPWLLNAHGTMIMRCNIQKQPLLAGRGLHVGGLVGIQRSSTVNDSERIVFFINRGNGWEYSGDVTPPTGDGVAMIRWEPDRISWYYTGIAEFVHMTSSPPPVVGPFGDTGLRIRQTNDYVESVVVFDTTIPDEHAWDIITMPEAWTMENTEYRGMPDKRTVVPLNSHLRYHRNNEGPLPY